MPETAPGAASRPADPGGDGLPRRLPLSTLERYMLEDDRPSHPMTGVHELVVRGPLETDLLQRALDATRLRHPLLRRIIDDSGKAPAWIPAPPQATVTVDRAAVGVRRTHPEGDWLDVRREIGLRIWVRDEAPGEDGVAVSRLSAAIHHCVADALGGLSFLIDLFGEISSLNGGSPLVPAPNPSRILHRGEFFDQPGLLPGLPKGRLKLWGHLLDGLRRMNKTATVPLAPAGDGKRVSTKPEPGGDVECPTPVDDVSPPRIAAFTEEETANFRAAAKARGMTLNDLALRDLFITIRDHNAQSLSSAVPTDDGPTALRINVPVNLRGPADLPASLRKPGDAGAGQRPGGLSIANKIGMALVTRPPELADDPEALLQSVHKEMAWVRETERGRRFVEAIQLAYRFTSQAPKRIFGETCYATAVLSNIGDLERVIPPSLRDDQGRLCAPAADPSRTLTVTEYATGSPGRPLTRATVLAASYGRRLHFYLRTDPQEISPEAADALLADLAARVRRSAGSNGSIPAT
ncbi:hypothetical protein [Alienimonas chondri]|uniref:hypothetical protein n=1 Tax=Alienimonas chondri TaxID=2681879 RepID=UPI0014878B22|nr:hypothetical protein [Alienimonas chondri]